MGVEVPTTDAGARSATYLIGDKYLTFRTYYSSGQQDLWLLDIYDYDGNPLIVGIAILPGSDNVIKGHGDTLNGFQLYVLNMDTLPVGDVKALGESLHLIAYAPGEENAYQNGDPLLTIDESLLVENTP